MNCEKFTRNQSGNILVHCNRSDPNRTYKNQEIHHNRTFLNYNLAPKHENMTDFEFMKNRCESLKILERNNVNWLVSWVVTIPADYTGSQELFFKEVYNFFEKKYGKENVVSSYVHLDETSPHMHFCFVPVIYDEKKQTYKVNAKVCINKVELQKIHPEMQEYLEEKLQTKVNILNGATKEGNKTVEQLKNEEKIKQKAITELIKNPSEEIKKAVIENIPEEQKKSIVEEEIETVKEELKRDPEFIKICKNKAMYESEKIEELEAEIEDLQGKKDYIKESIADLEIQHKKQRKQLEEEYEKEKQRYNTRILEMQNTTIEQEKNKPSFWNKIADKIFNFKIVATISFVMYQLSHQVPPERILKNVKQFRKNYDRYVDNPELVQRELKTMEYMDIGLEKIESSEQKALINEKSRDDYDLEI